MRKLAAWLLLLCMLLPCTCTGESVAERYGLTEGSSASDDSYTVAESQGVTLHVSCDETTVFPGETVTMLVTVNNHTQQTLEKLSLSEMSIGNGSWDKIPDMLPADGSLRAVYTVRIPDTLHDTAMFRLQWQDGSLMAQHELNVAQPMQLTLQGEVKEWPWQAGEEHTADFTVTNLGDMVLENVTLTLPGAYLQGEKIGDAVFLRKDRRKLKTAQQTDSFLLEELAPGDSVTMTAAWLPEALPEGEVALTMQAAVEADGRTQTRAAMVIMERKVIRPTAWTTMLTGSVSMGHVLAGLTALTLLTALAALLRARRLR